MLVVLAIIGVVTAVALVGESGFQRVSLVSNTAYDLAITIRNAEVFGISSNKGSGQYLAGYGLDLLKTNTALFWLFDDINPPTTTGTPANLCTSLPVLPGFPLGDPYAPNAKPGDCVYEPGSDALLQTYQLNNGITISNVCAVKGSTSYCWTGGNVSATQIDVVFLRPNTAAVITATNGGVFPVLATKMDYACIQLKGPGTNPTNRYIYVSALGQINAATSTCP